MQRTYLLLLALFSFFFTSGCAQHIAQTGAPPIVRVQLLAGQQHVSLSQQAPPTVRSSGDNVARRVDLGSGADVSYSPSGWRIGAASFAAGELIVAPQPAGTVAVNGQLYRGAYRFVPVGPDRFDVINDVDIDSYLAGVIASEMFKDWQIEAYKAQAITARTYALYEAKTAPQGRNFDLFDDTRSQVYGGMKAETAKSLESVRTTSGVVLAYGPAGHERIFKAYFSSCCGGIGQSAVDAFGEPDIPPLGAKNVGTCCAESTHYVWPTLTISKAELTRRIRAWGAKTGQPEKNFGELVDAQIAAVNQFGRPVRFYLIDSKGLKYSLTGEQFRWACNADAKGGPTLMSSYVRPVNAGDSIAFTAGHGYGHGVGLCQWCAEGRAEHGSAHEDIVRLAFPGAVLVRAY